MNSNAHISTSSIVLTVKVDDPKPPTNDSVNLSLEIPVIIIDGRLRSQGSRSREREQFVLELVPARA